MEEPVGERPQEPPVVRLSVADNLRGRTVPIPHLSRKGAVVEQNRVRQHGVASEKPLRHTVVGLQARAVHLRKNNGRVRVREVSRQRRVPQGRQPNPVRVAPKPPAPTASSSRREVATALHGVA